MIISRFGRKPLFGTVFLLSLLFLLLFSCRVEASQAEYEHRMQSIVDKMYNELRQKIDGLDPIKVDYSNELQTLENYALKYVELYRPEILVKNRLHELPAHHAKVRKKRWTAVNVVIKDLDFLHSEYEVLEIKLLNKKNKLILLSGAKLIFDYVLLPLDRWNVLAERIVYYYDRSGPVRFVPEGGLGATTASRRLGDISKELLAAHNALKKILYQTPKDSNDLYRLIHAGWVQAKKCRELSGRLQYSLRIDRDNNLAIAEKNIWPGLSGRWIGSWQLRRLRLNV